MSFDDRFELGELLRDDGIRTFSARDKTGGQDLLAHFFSNGAEAPKLLASLERLPERERQRIVDRGERDGAPYVVTGTLAGHPGFREWLTANAREAKPLGAAGAWKVIPAQPSVDEQFLSLFPTSESPQLQPEAAPPPPPPSAPEAGAFTRMFQAPANLFPPQPPSQLPPQPAPARSDLVNREPAKSEPAPNNEPARNNEPAKNNEPGEFTRMFQALPPQTQPGQTSFPTAPPPASPKTEAAGEFTRFFEAQVHESHVRQADLPPVQAMPAAARQGEFTRVFGPGQTLGRSGEKPGAAPPAPVPLRAPEAPRVPGPTPQATRAFTPSPFAAPASSSASPTASPSAPPSGASPFPAEQADGEFTRRFAVAPALSLGQPSETTAPSAPSTGNASPSGPAAASRWPLYLGIAAIAVLLVAALLFMLSRAK